MSELVSIVVPVYNSGAWLRRCLDSICSQTYCNLEILCVNDGSTDDSMDILDEYAARDSRIKVIHQENAGLSAARNTALAHATGAWVAGVDSDDYVAPDVIERAVSCITDEVDVVFFGVQMVGEHGGLVPDSSGYFCLATGLMPFTESLAMRLNVCFWSKLWRRSVIESNGLRFPEGLVHEDEAFYYLAAPWLRKAAFSPSIGYFYVQRSGSIMHSTRSILALARKYVKIGEFVRQRTRPDHITYYFSMMWRLYKQCFQHAGREERQELAAIFYSSLPESAPEDDYRISCMCRAATCWVRPEPSRLVYCVCGVPIFARCFDGLRFTCWQFAFGRMLRARWM